MNIFASLSAVEVYMSSTSESSSTGWVLLSSDRLPTLCMNRTRLATTYSSPSASIRFYSFCPTSVQAPASARLIYTDGKSISIADFL